MIELPGLVYRIYPCELGISIWHPLETNRGSQLPTSKGELHEWGGVIGLATRYQQLQERDINVKIEPYGEAAALGIGKLVDQTDSEFPTSLKDNEVLSPDQLRTILGPQYDEYVSQYNSAIERQDPND